MTQQSPQKNTPLAEHVLQRIDQEDIQPIPVWHFMLKNILFWVAAITSVIVGAITITASIFVVANAGWKYYTATHDSFFSFFIESLPYLWVAVTCLFIALTYENIRHTRKGYQFHLLSIVALSIGMNMVGGTVLYFTGVGQIFDQYVAAYIPFQGSIIEEQQERWDNEEEGLIAGSVESISENADWFVITTFSGHEWKVYTTELTSEDFSNIASFPEVRIVGTTTEELDSNELVACLVFPWEIHGSFSSQKPSHISYTAQLTNCLEPDCEINIPEPRITKCKDVEPYESLKLIRS